MRSLPIFSFAVAAFVAAQGAAAPAQTNYPNHPIQLVVTVPPGDHRINLECDGPKVIVPHDPRPLVFRVESAKIAEMD